jgi:hypothetical protein
MCESNHSAKEDEMRQARLKPDYQDTWHHCYNRTVGTRAVSVSPTACLRGGEGRVSQRQDPQSGAPIVRG